MQELIRTVDLDKALLVGKIREQFRNMDQLKYQRSLLEFFDDQGKFLGDNVFETTFKLRKEAAPLVYEVSGPYDVVSREYATVARVYLRGELQFECDLKPGIFQRTAAMVWLYLDTLGHPLENTLFIGAGKIASHVSAYLKHFSPSLGSIDYTDVVQKADMFEKLLHEIGLQTRYLEAPDLSSYNTIILATNTTRCIIMDENISTMKPGSVIVSLCTTSQTGEVSREVYARSDINTFLDYDLSRTFTADMRQANELGYLERAIYFRDVLAGGCDLDLNDKVNLIRLTGTPMQNVAVIDTMLEKENLVL
jgi:hypothetical protein